ncbi:MAG: gamma-glutamylcyclotransferase, partial [Rhodobacteraceae bacterium]
MPDRLVGLQDDPAIHGDALRRCDARAEGNGRAVSGLRPAGSRRRGHLAGIDRNGLRVLADRVFCPPLVVSQPAFLFGPLCDPELSAIVFGRPVPGYPARLKDHVLHHPNGEGFAYIFPFAGAWVDGEVVELEDGSMDRLRYYCGVLGCTFRKMAVMRNTETVATEVACAEQAESPSSTVWSFDDWQARTAKVAREAAAEIMRLMETHSIAQATAILTQIK